ncbi:hypothetical protein ScalyP_jg11046 [Parmales sp. scaly parma]|nr:hypothetical protein ScalyP_jg11046 [Parmales sp. scaly parma]
MGGVVGIPKVAKRPLTTANSPKLGSRRTDMGDFYSGSTAPRTTNNNINNNSNSNNNSNINNFSNNSLNTSTVSKFALTAKPFQRLVGGSDASNKKRNALQEKIQRQNDAARNAQNSFVARSLPITTLKPTIPTKNIRNSVIGLPNYDDEKENTHSNISSLSSDDSMMGGGAKRTNLSLRSTIRAQERGKFDARREKSARSRKAKLELTLNKLAEVTRNEMEDLRAGPIRDVMPTSGMR